MTSNYFFSILLGTSFLFSSSPCCAAQSDQPTVNAPSPRTSANWYSDYQQVAGRVAHQQLYQKMSAYSQNHPDDDITDFKHATQLWLDWYAVRNWVLPQLQAPIIDKAEALAHRDPVAAINFLHKNTGGSQPESQALNALLLGFIRNNLDSLWLSERRPALGSTAYDYANRHPQEFQTGELCYGVHYAGADWLQLEKKFAGQRLAEAAAYLSMQQQACGECEGMFDCYLARELAPAETFLQKYPHSELAERVVQQTLLRIQQHFAEQTSSTDFLSASDVYQPQEAASLLVSFESKLKDLAAPLQVQLKLGLLPFYLALNQATNSQRIIEWLKINAKPDVYQRALNLQSNYPKFALYLQEPKILSPNLIQLNWSWRKNNTPQDLSVWRANTADFSDARKISASIPLRQTSYLDTEAKPGQAYWYQLRSNDASAQPLSHRAYSEIDAVDQRLTSAPLFSWVLDKPGQQLYLQTPLRLSERQLIRVWQALPLAKLPAASSKLNYLVETPIQSLYLDYSGQRVLSASPEKAPRLQELRTPDDSTIRPMQILLSDTNQGWQIKANSALLQPQQKAIYFWQNSLGLWRSDLDGNSVRQIAADKSQNPQTFKASYMASLNKDEILIAGTWHRQAETTVGWRIWHQGQLSDVYTPLKPHNANSNQTFAYDAHRNGIWLVSKDQTTAHLVSLTGQIQRQLSPKDFPIALNARIERVLSNPARQEVYFASQYQIFRLNSANGIDLIWQQNSTQADDSGSGAQLQAKKQAILKKLQQEECQIQASWQGWDSAICRK